MKPMFTRFDHHNLTDLLPIVSLITFFFFVLLLKFIFCTSAFCLLPSAFILNFSAGAVFSDPTDSFLDDDINFEEIFTDLPQQFDIDSATVSDFSNLPYFTYESARMIVSFRDSLMTGFDEKSIRANLENIPGLSSVQHAILDYLLQTDRPGIFESLSGEKFSGSYRSGFIHHPEDENLSDGKYYFKIHGEHNQQINFTFVGERDSFEPRALDLFSANLSVNLDKAGTNLIIGDYRPGYGQRLVFSRYSRSYLSGTNVKAANPNVIANTSFEESLFLRGVYLKVRRGRFTAHLWSSAKKIDATIDESGKVLTIKATGYHYSGSARENLKENINGGRVVFEDLHGFTVGASGVAAVYSPVLARQADEKYINYPEGSHFNYVSVDGEYKRGPAVLFFEHAESNNNENASIGGLLLKNKEVRTCFQVRNFSKGYWAPHSGGFSSFGGTTNERGFYSAVQAELPYASRFIASMDLARMLSRSYSRTMPIFRKRLNFMLQSKFRSKLIGRIVSRSVRDSGDGEKRWSCRLHLEKRPKEKYSVGLRSLLAWSESSGEGGVYTEATLISHWNKLRLNFSVGLFDIPSYKSRFYRYEYDVPGRGLSRAVWGKGVIALIICRWGAFSVRYRFADSDLFDTSSEFTLQCDVVF